MTTKTKTSPSSKHTRLTPVERAEAASLFRSGSVTLDDLAAKFGKRPETFSRLFRKMGIEKGAAAAEIAKKATETVETTVVSDLQETLTRIKRAKDDNFKMAQGLQMIAWQELVRVRTAKLPIESLKDTMTTLKLAGEVIGNARKEIFAVLNVEKHEQSEELDELPELTVRELTTGEIDQLRNQVTEDDMGGDIVAVDTTDIDDLGSD